MKLFTAGPVGVRTKVLEKMSTQMYSHRSKEYAQLHQGLVEKLKKLMYTQNDVLLFTSSSTGVMEACARNCVDKKVLSTVCGSFSKRFKEVFEDNGKTAQTVEVELGKAITPDLLDQALGDSDAEAVSIVHNETSTGLMNPLEELAKTAKQYQVLLLVDTVTSLGGAKVTVDDLDIDVCFAGVQKCLGCPPGLAVASISQKAYEKAQQIENKGYYFSFPVMKKYADKNNTPATPPISIMHALDEELAYALENGLENRFAHYQELSKRVREGVQDMGFELFPDTRYASPTISCFKADGIDVPKMLDEMQGKGFILANGHGKLKNETFRIGNMGNLRTQDVEDMLEALKQTTGR